MDVGGEENSVESPLLLKSIPFHQGECVLAHFAGGIHAAKVLQVDSRAKRFYVHYKGFNIKWDAWVGIESLMKFNNNANEKAVKAQKKEHPVLKIKELKPKNPNVTTTGKKTKTMSKGGINEGWAENRFPPPFGNPGVKVGGQRAATPTRHVVTPASKPMTKLKGPTHALGSTLPVPPPRVPNVGAPVAEPTLKNDADLLDPENKKASDVLPPKTKANLLAMSEGDFSKNYDCTVVDNLVYMVEMKKRYEALKGKEIEVKEELTRCKATMESQVKKIGILSQGAVGMRKELDDANGKVKKMQVERSDHSCR